jgi:dTDP-4-amino-4,6-dideoxygalactose transaminase
LTSARIPFNRPCLSGGELENLAGALERMHISGDGDFTERCHRFLEREVGTQKALLTTSCTHALELAALLLHLEPDDEVVMPSFTFVSTANAFVLRGARPVFADIRSDTLNLDETALEAAITPRTKAIVVVHYAGVACEMEAILALAGKYNLRVIEDNAHGLFAKYRGRQLGTFGAMATQSFHETKNFTCGEGGALLLNDARYIEEAEIVREKGTNRKQYFRGAVDKYSWVSAGSSYLPSDLLAGFLLAQLENRDRIQAQRRRVWERYDAGLRAWADSRGVKRPFIPAHCEQPYHMYYLVMPSAEARNELIESLRIKDINAVFHYVPLHNSKMGREFGGADGDCPVTERVSERLVRLPFFNDLSETDQTRVIDAVQAAPLPALATT